MFDTEDNAIRQGCLTYGNVAFLVKKIARFERPENLVSNLIAL